ncbi:MAG: hypothetical protein GY929_20740 [Actinomycetia bacterium]|nr:hypothetical protein [Actinomycetes bacterium]
MPDGVLDPSVVVLRIDPGELSCASGQNLDYDDLGVGVSIEFEQVVVGDVFTSQYPPSVNARSVQIDC